MAAEEKVVAKRMIVDNDGEEAEKNEEFQPAPWTIAAIAWVDTEPLVGYHVNDVNSSDIPCVEFKDGKNHSECADWGPGQRRARAAETQQQREPATWSLQRWDAQWRWSWRLSQGDAEKRSGAEESVLARHAPRDLQQCMASSCTDCRVRTYSVMQTQHKKLHEHAKSTLTFPPSPLPPTPHHPSAYFCALSSVVSAKNYTLKFNKLFSLTFLLLLLVL